MFLFYALLYHVVIPLSEIIPFPPRLRCNYPVSNFKKKLFYIDSFVIL